MVLRSIYLVPLAYGACALGATGTKYFFVSLIRRYPQFLPFLSHTQVSLLGECLFCHLVSFSAFLLLLTCYIRHRQAVEYYCHRLEWESSAWRRASFVLAGVGSISAFFITIIAHCEDEKLATIHDVADSLAFFCGFVYAWGQTILSSFVIPRMCSLRVCVARFLIVLSETVAYGFYRFAKNDAELSSSWVVEASLWTVSVCFHLFVVSFFIELRFAYAHAPRVVFVLSDEVEELVYSRTGSID
ncbi:unnamed protein product [Caenorhabditis auriculariae]|uniref:CWH43-like N-terminal domain-containing protein n=1 Tax=Caenorhabditis auriculariae TaxID=2777116 RepID=A0A8S1H8Q1_9PELO|nr:unnamed protein product [Caenorhabditis auriculariae]